MKELNDTEYKDTKKQKYENYWKLTVEYTDIHKAPFRNTLSMIVDFIDTHSDLKSNYNSTLYKELQTEIYLVYKKKDLASTRKSINQMIKLGFIHPGLKGYHRLTPQFIRATTKEKRNLIFSEIFYTSANFQSSVKNDNSHIKNINFFLKTLMYKKNQKLNKKEIVALISSDITSYPKGYMSEQEIESQIQWNKFNKFEQRKYNQISYFFCFLKYVPGITISDDKSLVYYTEDANIKLSSNIDVKRDPTLFRIMSENIKEESRRLYGGKVVCYFTKKEQKGLVVSHIIPSAESLRRLDIETAYNYKNALLLEPNSDAYFDKHNMSFDNSGNPIYDDTVPDTFIKDRKNMFLDSCVLEGRKNYLEHHYNVFRNAQ
ncbi:HNH endonuclease signature motif containing protein [Enterococcus faecium]|nr:HNH endonuclease [Enterococcus faecium]